MGVTDMKVKVRLNAFSANEKTFDFKEGDSLQDIFDKVCSELKIEKDIQEYLHVIMDGYEINRPLWCATKPTKGSSVMVAIIPAGGSGRGIFKQVAILAVAVAVSYATAGLGTPLSAALVAGATIGTTLALNALMPEPVPGVPNLGATGTDAFESSQMYTITSQSNSVKKYKGVPKVYGTYRMYPNVAANPYTDIAADDSTGELVQFFYAIYDFGLGPLDVSQLKIGETLLSDFADVEYNLVDPNRPDYANPIDEPEWDKPLIKNFAIYKGDGDTLPLSVIMNFNQEDGAAQEDYEAIRNTTGQPDGADQEISLVFVTPRGLNTVDTDGSNKARTIELDVEFAEVGTDDWKSYSDVNYVSSWDIVGGQDNTTVATTEYYPPVVVFSPTNAFPAFFENIESSQSPIIIQENVFTAGSAVGSVEFTVRNYSYVVTGFIAKGALSVIAKEGIGTYGEIKINGVSVGLAQSETPIGGGYANYVLENPVPVQINIYTARMFKYFEENIFAGQDKPWTTFEKDTTTTPAAVRYSYLLGSIASMTASSSKPHYMSIKFKPINRVNYKVKVVRKRSYGGADYSITDDLTWSSLSARYDRSPIDTVQRHVFLELRIRATNQLNGAISTLSGVVDSIIDVYNPTTELWEPGKTSNPAWVFCDLLTGNKNKRAVDKSRLDIDSLLEWSEFCDEVPDTPPSRPTPFINPRFTSNFIFDFDSTLQEILNKVSNSCQASINFVDGKYGVLIDKKKDIPVQVFTPRNSWNFSSNRSYIDPPHALRVKYIDAETWAVDEIIVYADGYDQQTAEEFEDITSFACIDQAQAWRFGRFALAQAKFRKELITIEVDFEHLVCTRGDFVQITQDVMKVGGTAARVIYADGNVIRIDERFSYSVGPDYGYTYRPVDGEIATSTMTITSPNTATVDGPLPSVGDLIIWGEVGSITFDCLVKSITPSDKLNATLTLVEKADIIYEAESTGLLPSYNPMLAPQGDDVPPEKVKDLVVLDNSYDCTGYNYQYFIQLDWLVPEGSVYSAFEIHADYGKGFDLVDTITGIGYKYIVDPANLSFEHSFKVIAVASDGNKLPLGDVDTVTATPLPKTANPSDVLELNLNVTGELVQIEWPAVADCDIIEYLIRFSPVSTGSWEESIPLQRSDRRTTSVSVQARTGSYFIKAIDFNGNESTAAAKAITSIPALTNLNIIDETNDFPTLLGTKDRVEKVGDTIMLQETMPNEYFSEGTYYFESFLDVGDIFTVRLQSLIRAEGFTPGDIMSNWPTLDDVIALANSRSSEWDVETYYRATESFNVMSEWASMSDIDPISEGDPDNWSPWRKFTMGDFTGRIFQFKLVLKSYRAAVTPRVFDGVIRADMPDRRDIFNNLLSEVLGTSITYQFPFKGPGASPAVQITQDNAQQGDYYKLTSKTLSGFTITFYDKNDTPVQRQFDVAADGYGRKTGSVL